MYVSISNKATPHGNSCWFLDSNDVTLSALFTKPPYTLRCTERSLEVVLYGSSHWQPMDTFLFHRNYTRQTSGMAVSREAAGFVNSAVWRCIWSCLMYRNHDLFTRLPSDQSVLRISNQRNIWLYIFLTTLFNRIKLHRTPNKTKTLEYQRPK